MAKVSLESLGYGFGELESMMVAEGSHLDLQPQGRERKNGKYMSLLGPESPLPETHLLQHISNPFQTVSLTGL